MVYLCFIKEMVFPSRLGCTWEVEKALHSYTVSMLSKRPGCIHNALIRACQTMNYLIILQFFSIVFYSLEDGEQYKNARKTYTCGRGLSHTNLVFSKIVSTSQEQISINT